MDLEARLGDLDLERDVVLSTASIAAMDAATSDNDKIAKLADALANVTVNHTWAHDEAVTLMRHVSHLTASHLRVLEMLRDPEEWATRPTESGSYLLRDMIEDAFSQAGEPVVGLRTILQDLEPNDPVRVLGEEQINALSERFGPDLSGVPLRRPSQRMNAADGTEEQRPSMVDHFRLGHDNMVSGGHSRVLLEAGHTSHIAFQMRPW